MRTDFNVAVVGATGIVGEVLLEILEERAFPIKNIYPLASENSSGKRVRFGGKHVIIQDIAQFDFSKIDIAFFSAGEEISARYVPQAVKQGCVCIDNTVHFRYDPDVPLVIPEVNPEAITQYQQRYIIANPNCSTVQMLVALKPIYDAVGIARINVVTYQSVSGAGRKAINELIKQTTHLLSGQSVEPEVFSVPIAFNVIPQIDEMLENGYTKEEMKMLWETKKILDDPYIAVNATAVRVPVLYGHSAAIHLETEQKISVAEAVRILGDAPGVQVLSDGEWPTAMTHGANADEVFIGRIREDISHPHGLDLWIVADNVRKGGALNAVQIAEMLIVHPFFLLDSDNRL